RFVAFVAGDPASPTSGASSTPPPIEHGPPTVDASQLPDPASIPRFNSEASTSRAWLLAEGPAHAPTDGKRYVTLTFDDGPFPETTPTVLRTLRKYRTRATFFFIGRYLEGDEERAVKSRAAAREIAAAGHYIGSHSQDHLHLP